MIDDLTPEQKAAHRVLDAAIIDAAAVDGPGVVTGWVAIAAITDADAEGDSSGVVVFVPNGSQPWPITLGIVEAARINLHAEFAAVDE